MKKILMSAVFFFLIIGGGLYLYSKPAKCADCNQGKQCTTSYDCGEIGICICQFSWLEEQEEEGGIPDYGTCDLD